MGQKSNLKWCAHFKCSLINRLKSWQMIFNIQNMILEADRGEVQRWLSTVRIRVPEKPQTGMKWEKMCLLVSSSSTCWSHLSQTLMIYRKGRGGRRGGGGKGEQPRTDWETIFKAAAVFLLNNHSMRSSVMLLDEGEGGTCDSPFLLVGQQEEEAETHSGTRGV